MFFEKVETYSIDGTNYIITNAAQVEMWVCKCSIVDIFNFLDADTVDMNRSPDSYQSWKKELIKLLKDWDKNYVKHMGNKGTYGEMNNLHMSAMKPLSELIEANMNFHNLEIMIAKPNNPIPIPDFRRLALEEKFCQKLTGVCEIFRDFGNDKLEDHFDIKQMLKISKIDGWQKIVPFFYFITPLHNSITKVRKALLDMQAAGVLFIKYIVEDNESLKKDVIDMVKKDIIAQWLMGDELKQDQFNFLYEVVKIVYDSALRDKLIKGDKEVVNEVIPQLVAFKSVMVIRNIQLKKAKEVAHEKEKAEREGVPVKAGQKNMKDMTEEEIVAQRMENEKDGGGFQKSEAQIAAEEEEKERKIYGRHWVWDGYFNERNKDQWLETAEDLKHVNDMVLQDIEDYILL